MFRDKCVTMEKEYKNELIALLGNEYSEGWAFVIYGLKCLGLIIILASLKEDL